MPESKNILIIDDDTYICNLLSNYLNQKDYDTDVAYTGNSARKLITKKHFDLVLCDFRLPDSDGLKMLAFIKSLRPAIPVIIMTAYAEVKMAVEMIKQGAFDYITKPLQPEEVLNIISKALITGQGNLTVSSFGSKFITGKSEKIKEVMQQVEVVAPTDVTVLVEGETGSGKEYIARAIHFKSKRKDKPFIAVDCGAIPKELANSELFGHIKGAFTGAINDKKGVFEQAKGGTLFLDEVGNLPHANQVKLLRALQERIITRVGDNKAIKVDVRLIAASNESLFRKVEKGNFREDLYHRLNGFKIQIPALRHRKEDIMEFVSFFISEANKAFNKSIQHLDNPSVELIMNYYWHGNLRELQNVINRMVLLSRGETLTADLLPDEIRFNSFQKAGADSFSFPENEVPDLKSATLITEREVIQNALIKTNNNKSKAAKLLNIDRKTLYNKIKLYNLEV
jgi:two-component system response regulator HydG